MPALHSKQIDAPVEPLYLPASQATHALALQLPLLGLALPAAHCTGQYDADGQYEPAGHSVQLSAALKLYVPRLHDEQVCVFVVLLYLPAGHDVQLVALAELYVPALHDEQIDAPVEPL